MIKTKKYGLSQCWILDRNTFNQSINIDIYGFFRVWNLKIWCKNIFVKIAAEVAAPLSQTKKITMVSDGTGDIGASRITGEVIEFNPGE